MNSIGVSCDNIGASCNGACACYDPACAGKTSTEGNDDIRASYSNMLTCNAADLTVFPDDGDVKIVLDNGVFVYKHHIPTPLNFVSNFSDEVACSYPGDTCFTADDGQCRQRSGSLGNYLYGELCRQKDADNYSQQNNICAGTVGDTVLINLACMDDLSGCHDTETYYSKTNSVNPSNSTLFGPLPGPKEV